MSTQIYLHAVNCKHKYLKKSRLLKFCYVPAISAAFSKGIFAAATNCTDQTTKAALTCH
jgi:hypothetical protein